MLRARPIWLSPETHPTLQRTFRTVFDDKTGCEFAMVEFSREYRLARAPGRVRVRAFGDTKFWLWLNGAFVGMGPVCAGGDYGSTDAMPKQYACAWDVDVTEPRLCFFARVQLSPEVMTDSSVGRGGFLLECEGADAFTDETWLARANPAYRSACELDSTIASGAWEQAVEVENVWNVADAPIPMLAETDVYPDDRRPLTARPGETVERTYAFDRVYPAYPRFSLVCIGRCRVEVRCFELPAQAQKPVAIVSDTPMTYRCPRMFSVGLCHIKLTNESEQDALVANVSLAFSRYPAPVMTGFRCSDPALEKLYDVARWTLLICRQSLHLDSPLHQETLGCTGDYYVESLMEYAAFDDARLVRLDLVRTADWLTAHDAVMFHTSYSLIWTRMLWDYYRFTGDGSVFSETRSALDMLLARFHGYVGESGLLEHAPNYMFVDWLTVDGFSMHHPPKALGQTCLCAFYLGALDAGARVYRAMGDEAAAKTCEARFSRMKGAMNALLYDESRGLYIAGLGTPGEVNAWQCENTDRRYYTLHANALCALYGACEGERARTVMRRAMTEKDVIDAQPYFMHFVMEALEAADLFGEFGMDAIRRYLPMTAECDKGLAEGWHSPGGTYSFDHSHAWGGTPVYQLKARLLGLQIDEPGMTRVTLRPRLLGLESWDIEWAAPMGVLRVSLRAGGAPSVEAPEGMTVRLEM